MLLIFLLQVFFIPYVIPYTKFITILTGCWSILYWHGCLSTIFKSGIGKNGTTVAVSITKIVGKTFVAVYIYVSTSCQLVIKDAKTDVWYFTSGNKKILSFNYFAKVPKLMMMIFPLCFVQCSSLQFIQTELLLQVSSNFKIYMTLIKYS